MERKHVEAFFRDGELQLSSLKKFRKNPDEQSGDAMEGLYQVAGYMPWPDSSSAGNGMVETGWQAYILCGTAHNAKAITEGFGDAAIQIFDTTSFGIEIGKHIVRLQKGIEGFCNYNDGPIEYVMPHGMRPEEAMRALEERGELGQLDISHLTGGIDTPLTNSIFFKKRPRDEKRGKDFNKENEYRWVWVTDRKIEESDGTLIIKCPSARYFCRPFFRD